MAAPITRRTILALPPALWLAAAARAAFPLERRGAYLFLETRVNGQPVAALLDSGAEMSVIDRATARTLGLSPAAGMDADMRGTGAAITKAQIVDHVAIAAAGIALPPAPVVIADLADIGHRLVHAPVAMILGRELFDAGVLAIDIRAATIAEWPTGQPRPGRRLPLRPHLGNETVPIRINGMAAQATFDTGNGGRTLVSRRFADRTGLLAPDRLAGFEEGGGMGGPVRRRIVRIGLLEVAGRAVSVGEAAVEPSDQAADATIGIDVLRHFRIVSDFAGRAVWLDPA